jgi:hypothetical protein
MVGIASRCTTPSGAAGSRPHDALRWLAEDVEAEWV